MRTIVNVHTEDVCYNIFTKESAKALVERTLRGMQTAATEVQRNQLMGLTTTVIAALVGTAFATKNDTLLWVALVFCLFMHGLDTMLLDLSKRQHDFGRMLSNYLLQWDSLKDDEIKIVMKKVYQGNEPNNPEGCPSGKKRKIHLFFCPETFIFLWWWGLTIGIVILMLLRWLT
jgi:hypothetical protein